MSVARATVVEVVAADVGEVVVAGAAGVGATGASTAGADALDAGVDSEALGLFSFPSSNSLNKNT